MTASAQHSDKSNDSEHLKRTRMSLEDASYVIQTSTRIVRMFECYVERINPESEAFTRFICQYLEEKNMTNPRLSSYSELYKLIKAGIRDYLGQLELSNQNTRECKSK
jgi:hypothetical protein